MAQKVPALFLSMALNRARRKPSAQVSREGSRVPQGARHMAWRLPKRDCGWGNSHQVGREVWIHAGKFGPDYAEDRGH